jgi:hypothetical protein
MRRRLLVVALAVGGCLSVLAPLAGPAKAATVPPACVVVHGPNGLTIQVGYAPTGPSGCHQVG